MRRAPAVIGLVVVGVCGSSDEPASSDPTPTTERPPVVTVASEIVDGSCGSTTRRSTTGNAGCGPI